MGSKDLIPSSFSSKLSILDIFLNISEPQIQRILSECFIESESRCFLISIPVILTIIMLEGTVNCILKVNNLKLVMVICPSASQTQIQFSFEYPGTSLTLNI